MLCPIIFPVSSFRDFALQDSGVLIFATQFVFLRTVPLVENFSLVAVSATVDDFVIFFIYVRHDYSRHHHQRLICSTKPACRHSSMKLNFPESAQQPTCSFFENCGRQWNKMRKRKNTNTFSPSPVNSLDFLAWRCSFSRQ